MSKNKFQINNGVLLLYIFKVMFVFIIHEHGKSPILIYQFFLFFKMGMKVDFNFCLLQNTKQVEAKLDGIGPLTSVKSRLGIKCILLQSAFNHVQDQPWFCIAGKEAWLVRCVDIKNNCSTFTRDFPSNHPAVHIHMQQSQHLTCWERLLLLLLRRKSLQHLGFLRFTI